MTEPMIRFRCLHCSVVVSEPLTALLPLLSVAQQTREHILALCDRCANRSEDDPDVSPAADAAGSGGERLREFLNRAPARIVGQSPETIDRYRGSLARLARTLPNC